MLALFLSRTDISSLISSGLLATFEPCMSTGQEDHWRSRHLSNFHSDPVFAKGMNSHGCQFFSTSTPSFEPLENH